MISLQSLEYGFLKTKRCLSSEERKTKNSAMNQEKCLLWTIQRDTLISILPEQEELLVALATNPTLQLHS